MTRLYARALVASGAEHVDSREYCGLDGTGELETPLTPCNCDVWQPNGRPANSGQRAWRLGVR